jgi:hypothetical protein
MTLLKDFLSLKVAAHKPKRGQETRHFVFRAACKEPTFPSSPSIKRTPIATIVKTNRSKTFKMRSTSTSLGRQASVVPTGFFLQNPSIAFGTANHNRSGSARPFSSVNHSHSQRNTDEETPNRVVVRTNSSTILQPRRLSYENLLALSPCHEVTDYIPVPHKSNNNMPAVATSQIHQGGASENPTNATVGSGSGVDGGGSDMTKSPDTASSNNHKDSDGDVTSDGSDSMQTCTPVAIYVGLFGATAIVNTPVPRRLLLPSVLGFATSFHTPITNNNPNAVVGEFVGGHQLGNGDMSRLSPPRNLSLKPRARSIRSGSHILRGVNRHHSENWVHHGSSRDSTTITTTDYILEDPVTFTGYDSDPGGGHSNAADRHTEDGTTLRIRNWDGSCQVPMFPNW